LDVTWSLSALDPLMLCVVTGVAFSVHMFMAGYSTSDRGYVVLSAWVSWFAFFMLMLVMADQLVVLLVGWEGIGVCSFALVGFWNSRLAATKSSVKAVLVNRLGDGMLVLAVLWCMWHSGSSCPELMCYGAAPSWLVVAFFLGSIAKSAQFGWAVWLADAMEGPTPVSALIHAATLVTAGVILLTRTGAMCRFLMVVLGVLTCVSAATIGFFQNDAKRVIAYSTCSQLGYMVVSHGLGHSALAMAHLLTHAGFKAALFLGAGMVIHATWSIQDQRRYGGVAVASTPTTIATLSLAGCPFLAGFYTKDGILEVSWAVAEPTSDIASFGLLFVVCLTLCYGSTLCWSSFATNPSCRMLRT
jgi:NADH:ubiquinone oxidoreductase subunit 5 (subunit L)/multisubunit Na+/H+ antiporter MnhA subunit